VRHTLRILGWGFLSLVTAETLVGIIDWFARWDWFNQVMLDHPHLASFIRTPVSYLVLIIVGFSLLFIERKLKTAKITGRIVSLEGLPDTATTSMAIALIEEEKKPGWNEHPMNWHWFAKIVLVNESETPTTIGEVQVRLKWKQRKVLAKCTEDFGNYIFAGKHEEIPNLVKQLRGVPLTHGIGHDGWVRFNVPAETRKFIEAAKVDFWILDSMQQKHKLRRDNAEMERVKITKKLSR
jgi:hypothetical protein